MSIIGAPHPSEMNRAENRMTFLYAEHCTIHIDGGAITITLSDGRVAACPGASITTVILGPGSRITHDAVKLLAQNGTVLAWMGADLTRMYAIGRTAQTESPLPMAQAAVVSSERKNLDAAKRMYDMRFPGIEMGGKKLATLRGMEGARMKRLYRSNSSRTGVPWHGRNYTVGDIDVSDPVNQAITIGNQILYAVELGIICSIGAIPSLGIIHRNFSTAFVDDVADLYKAETSIPIGFDVIHDLGADADTDEIDREIRLRMRKSMFRIGLLKRSITDIETIILGKRETLTPIDIKWIDAQAGLWTPHGVISEGINYNR